ncbi:carbohydrate kinase family protein [Alicyclobacillus dauci]|uniref:Carbohydrate kinase n=1 Tax=Alicyclobacillus dauci TaxID=1475485 RepID=A0ABY6Z6U8_9BACL|nr:carbohydrate kinase [Alicyclobacillus dauci]WAH37979.1 carbohydrate kinase [Alicyclobacillus dauci]
MFDLVTVGELLIDFTPVPSVDRPTFQQNAGGAPANVVTVAALMGKKTAFIGKVGDDAFGRFLCKTLTSYGVDTSGLVMSEEFPTTLAFVHLDDSGERSFSFFRHLSADVMLNTSELRMQVIENTKVFHFGSVSMTEDPSRTSTIEAIQAARVNGAIITFDPNLRPALWRNQDEAKEQILNVLPYVDVLKISDEELSFLTGETTFQAGALSLKKQYQNISVILVTLGAKGCYYLAVCGEGSVPSFPVNPVDTTGAGDAFMGTFISGLLDTGKRPTELHQEELVNIIRAANTSGALTTTRPGGIPALPTREEVVDFMNKH